MALVFMYFVTEMYYLLITYLLFFNLGIAMTGFSHKWWTREGYDTRCPEQDLGVMEILEK